MNSNEFEDRGAALEALADGPAQRAADAISAAFERTGETIETAFERAAGSGEARFSRMTDAILRDLARLTAQSLIERPINDLIDLTIANLPVLGGRAEGGPVAPGGAYLVGERGPEVFVPSTAGQVGQPATQRPVVVNITVGPGGDASAIEASQGRISRALARAVAQGSRQL